MTLSEPSPTASPKPLYIITSITLPSASNCILRLGLRAASTAAILLLCLELACSLRRLALAEPTPHISANGRSGGWKGGAGGENGGAGGEGGGEGGGGEGGGA
eukprot:scaffold22784_cov56-Phaeocystis_antarctica.AAC.1